MEKVSFEFDQKIESLNFPHAGIVLFVVGCITLLFVYMALVAIKMKFTPAGLSVTSDPVQEELKHHPVVEPAPVTPNSRRKSLSVNAQTTIRTMDRRMTVWQEKVEQQRANVYQQQSICG